MDGRWGHSEEKGTVLVAHTLSQVRAFGQTAAASWVGSTVRGGRPLLVEIGAASNAQPSGEARNPGYNSALVGDQNPSPNGSGAWDKVVSTSESQLTSSRERRILSIIPKPQDFFQN